MVIESKMEELSLAEQRDAETEMYVGGGGQHILVPNRIYSPNIYNALLEVMREVTYIQKMSKNQFHKYKYVDERTLLEAVRPAMLENNILFLLDNVTDKGYDKDGNKHISCRFRFHHVPSNTSHTVDICSTGNDVSKTGKIGDKGIYIAITGAVKYALFKNFLIPTGDDPEKDERKPSSEKDEVDDPEIDLDNWIKVVENTIKMTKSSKALDKVVKDNMSTFTRAQMDANQIAAKFKELIEAKRGEL